MSEVIDLLKKSGYSHKAIEYHINKVNAGRWRIITLLGQGERIDTRDIVN